MCVYIYIYILEYSGTQCGAVTNGRKRCFFRKSSAFAASLW